MSEFWNSKYNTEDYLYGIEPNVFFKSELDKLPVGKILVAADGEGRNAVYAAEKGWDVDVVDASSIGKEKALRLAKSKNVKINYIIAELGILDYGIEKYDCVAMTFLHLNSNHREIYHNNFIKLLKAGGHIILQGFNKKQIKLNSGGPKNIDMLYTEEDLRKDFSSLKELSVFESNEILNEGIGHNGNAELISLVGKK